MPSLRRQLPLFLLLVAVGGACGKGRETPAIAFTYNFGDTAFQQFLEREVERSRPPGGVRIRVVGADLFDSKVLATSALSAEVRRATELAADPDVLVAVGPGGSREALQVAPIYREARLVNLAPTATSRLLSSAGDYTLTIAPNDSIQGEFIGAFADTVLRARSAAIFYVPDEYGIGLGAGTASALAARGVVLIDRSAMRLTRDCLAPEGRRFYDGLAAELALRGTPDVVVIAARTVEAGCLARPLRAQFPRAVLIAGDGTYLETAFFDRAGAAAEGVHLVAFWHPGVADSASRRFARVFAEQVHRRPRHGDAVFYDATMLAAAAIREGGADRVAVRRWMLSLGGDRAVFTGITGPMEFRAGHRHTMLMTRVRGRDSEVLGR